MKSMCLWTSVFLSGALVAGCGGSASYSHGSVSTVPSAEAISNAELDPRLSHDDAVAMARFDRATGYRARNESVAGLSPEQRMVTARSEEEEAVTEPVSPSPASPPSDENATAELASESSEPDQESLCIEACTYRDQICELSSRICDIASRHPEYSDIAERCNDGQRRCDAARANTRTDCDC